jgi:CheY-like chemotaxis protein
MNESPDVTDHPARILVVDDGRLNRQVLAGMLMPEGLLILTAASCEKALGWVARQPPDLILLDVIMAEMDGYQAAGTIRGNPAKISPSDVAACIDNVVSPMATHFEESIKSPNHLGDYLSRVTRRFSSLRTTLMCGSGITSCSRPTATIRSSLLTQLRR